MEKPIEDKTNRRILIISNNPLSKIQHNGKTLSSFFEGYSPVNIAQLYFNSAAPDNMQFSSYFRVSDTDLLKSISGKSSTCGGVVYPSERYSAHISSQLFSKIKKTYLSRIGRDMLWKTHKWKTENLNKWLDNFNPEIVFFVAGDSGFSYDVCKYISDKYATKLVVYITDDYILPRFEISPFFWLRRGYLLKKMKSAVNRSDLFITISEEMRKTYKDVFCKDSAIAINMSNSLYNDTKNTSRDKDLIVMVYTGGLHFHRDITLSLLAEAIRKYNLNSNKRKAFLSIYSTATPSKRMFQKLNIDGASKFCGGLDSDSVKDVLNNCDLPVHVESFSRKAIASTRLSVSTKISEYLSLGKCILAIGPEEIASMKYLADSAYCITDKSLIYRNLELLLNDEVLQNEYAKKSTNKYMNYHNKEVATNDFLERISNL